MKKIFVFFLLVFLFFSSMGQGYYDALKIESFTGFMDPNTKKYVLIINENNLRTLETIMNNYGLKKDQSQTNAELRKAIKKIFEDSNNPFLIVSATGQSDDDFNNLSTKVSDLISIPSNIGGLNVTNIADGLAKFLVERTKQELSITFFEKFKDKLETLEELQILFPTTYKNLTVFGEEIYMFSGYIEMLRQGFQKDLANLLPNLQNLVDDGSMDDVFVIYPELRIVLSDALFIVTDLKNGNHIGDVLDSYSLTKAKKDSLDKIDKNLYASFTTLNLISQSFRSEEDKYWINSKELRKLFENDDVTFRIYLGLLYQKIKLFEKDNDKIEFGGKALLEILTEKAEKFEQLKTLIKPQLEKMITRGEDVSNKFKTIKKLQDDPNTEPSYQEYYELLNSSLNFIEEIENIHKMFVSDETPKFDTYLNTARSMGNIYVDVNQKQYVSAISELAYLYEDVVFSKRNELKEYHKAISKIIESGKDIKESINKINNKQYSYLISTDFIEAKKVVKQSDIEKAWKAFVKKNSEFNDQQDELIKSLIKYGNFIALVAKAENSDQVQAAIEAVALPAGSSRIKRESKFNIALNAYMGLYAGGENVPIDGKTKGKFSTGLSAPIGLTISKGFAPKKSNRGGKSLSLMLSLVDVGALASFRFQDDSTASVPEIQFGDILSPGAFLVFGFGKIPLSIGGGYQIGPRLHKVTATDASKYSDIYHRISGFIAVDIPLLNFYTKSR